MTRRVAQLSWILDHLADLNADFRVFYRMSWAEAVRDLSGPELFQLCHRVFAYQGVLRGRAEQWARAAEAAEKRGTGGREVRRRIEGDRGAIEAAGYADLFD